MKEPRCYRRYEVLVGVALALLSGTLAAVFLSAALRPPQWM